MAAENIPRTSERESLMNRWMVATACGQEHKMEQSSEHSTRSVEQLVNEKSRKEFETHPYRVKDEANIHEHQANDESHSRA